MNDMIIMSQNLTNYDIPIPDDVIFRINLAWVNDLSELKNLLEKHKNHSIFMDLPIGRTKPPNNSYSIDELGELFKNHKNIKYFAISNVNNKDDLKQFKDKIPSNINLIPKIESTDGVENISSIIKELSHDEKIVMLDHDDLFTSILKQNLPIPKFKEYFLKLVDFCEKNNVHLLRTVGVIFSDEEKKISQYLK